MGFIIGLFVGAFIGVVFMCLCNAAAKADEQMKDHINDKNKIDAEHRIESVINDCKVTICFSKNRNNHVERNVLENLLDTFENRMNAQIGC